MALWPPTLIPRSNATYMLGLFGGRGMRGELRHFFRSPIKSPGELNERQIKTECKSARQWWRRQAQTFQGCSKLAIQLKAGRAVSPKPPCLGGSGRLGEAALPELDAPLGPLQ